MPKFPWGVGGEPTLQGLYAWHGSMNEIQSGAAASTADGGTINHGLSTTPTVVIATPRIASQMVSVTARGATNFTVAIKTDAGAAGTTQTIDWIAWA